MLRFRGISSLAGGILVFLTGQAEVHSLCRRLRKAFPFQKPNTAGNALCIYPTERRACFASKNKSFYLKNPKNEGWGKGSLWMILMTDC